MLNCQQCTVRVIKAILRDVKPQNSRLNRPLILAPTAAASSRRHNTTLTQHDLKTDDEAIPFDGAIEQSIISPVPRRHLQLELKWLTDRVKLANYVRDTVSKKDGFEKAVALVRLASGSETHGECVVAWNHILRYAMDNGKMDTAWSLYNDMKKRAQWPDSYTYAAMIKGLVKTSQKNIPPHPKRVARAVSIFNSMYGKTSRVKPTAIHANAAIRACASIGDMDSLWSVVSRLDENGANAADTVTYTIILDALRTSTLLNMKGDLGLDQMQRLKLEAVEQGRTIWLDIVKRWRAGEINIDERLVAAMSQLLLFSPRLQDWDEVPNLIAQTMDIDRRLATLRSGSRNIEHIPGAATMSQGDTANADVFLPIEEMPSTRKPRSKNPGGFSYIRPGNITLTLLLDACHVLRAPEAAAEYWKLLTKAPYRIVPDSYNLEGLLKICATNRASAFAATVLTEAVLRDKIVVRGACYGLAMEACTRDMRNAASFDHAGKVIDVMTKHLHPGNLLRFTEYLDLALRSRDDAKITQALDKVFKAMSDIIPIGSQTLDGSELSTEPRMILDARRVCQSMVGTIDTLMPRTPVAETDSEWQAMQQRRIDLTKAISILKSLEYAHPQPTAYTDNRRARAQAASDNSSPRPRAWKNADRQSKGTKRLHEFASQSFGGCFTDEID